MDFKKLREDVCEANLELNRRGLVAYTWGNASGIDRESGIVAIKPSGVSYSSLTPEDIVLVELAAGGTVNSQLKPSSDTPTHLFLYREFPMIGGVAHTHSTYATAFAQAKRSLPCLGTTHADYFCGEVPVTRKLRAEEVVRNYEENTGRTIAELHRGAKDNILAVPAALVSQHGPFTWGENVESAVEASVVLEKAAKIAASSLVINPAVKSIDRFLLEKHYLRKHGAHAYYGQG